MRELKTSVVALVALLGLVGVVVSLPMDDHHDVGGKLSALSLADNGASSTSSSRHQASASKPMDVDVNHASPPFQEYHVTSLATGKTIKPDKYLDEFINPAVHRPEKVGYWHEHLDKEYRNRKIDHHLYMKEKSKARVASKGIEQLVQGRPVRLALEDGVKILHPPGKLNALSAMHSHYNNHIYEIQHTGQFEDAFRMNSPPRNDPGARSSSEQAKMNQKELEAKVALAQKSVNDFKSRPKHWFNPHTGKPEQVPGTSLSSNSMGRGQSPRRSGRLLNDAHKGRKERLAKSKPY